MKWQRIITGLLTALVVVLVAVVVMFAFGAPQRPVGRSLEAASLSATSVSPPGELLATGASDVPVPDSGTGETSDEATGGTVPEPDPSSPFAIEIPGCVCHSDDPMLVQQHSEYRMNQCFGCHAGGMPEMGQ
ncbi:MAG: hypothetical protein ACYC6C_09885 [Coriobacteriia bacterium]